jgi:hypothetical protein
MDNRLQHSSFKPLPCALHRGDVVFVTLPQTLGGDVTQKKRPVVVLNSHIGFFTNGRGFPIKPVSFMAVDGTTQQHLVDGRPHIAFEIPNSGKMTYSLTDSRPDAKVVRFC